MKKILSSEITPYNNLLLIEENLSKTASAFSIASSLSFSAQALHSEDLSKYDKQLDEGR